MTSSHSNPPSKVGHEVIFLMKITIPAVALAFLSCYFNFIYIVWKAVNEKKKQSERRKKQEKCYQQKAFQVAAVTFQFEFKFPFSSFASFLIDFYIAFNFSFCFISCLSGAKNYVRAKLHHFWWVIAFYLLTLCVWGCLSKSLLLLRYAAPNNWSQIPKILQSYTK